MQIQSNPGRYPSQKKSSAMKAAAKPNPPPLPSAATSTQPSTKAASSSSSSAADPNPKRILPTAADVAHSTPSHPTPNPDGAPNPPPLLPSPHAAHLQPPQPLPPPRPLLTVAAVEAAMASIPPPPQYGLECLDRRTVALSDGTVRTYFALPLEPPAQFRQPPIFTAPHLGPPGPGPGLNRWIPPLMHSAPPPGSPQKRKQEGQSNGGAPGESSGRQHQQHQKPEERRIAKQFKVETPELDAKTLEISFLKMVRVINENTEVKKNYRANGQISQLKCVVCNRDSGFACTPQSFVQYEESRASCGSSWVAQSYMCSYGLELLYRSCKQKGLPNIVYC